MLSPQLEEDIQEEINLRHLARFSLGVAVLLITLVLMPFLQDALNTLETTREQVTALDTSWNTVTIPPNQHAADNGWAGKGDTITVQFLVTTALIVDRDNSVDFYIMDEENYQRNCNGEDYDPLLASPDHESGTFSKEVPTSDIYYIVFDNEDDIFFEPEEEVKYRFVIYTFEEDEELDPVVAVVLLLPSLVLMTAGGYGWMDNYYDRKRREEEGR